METGLKDKNVVVTGGTRGIGKSIITAFAKEGANIWFCYHSNEALAKGVMEELKELYPGSKISAKAVDVSSAKECEAWVEEILTEAPSLDVLVNNAGINRDKLLLMQSEEDFTKVIENNLMSVFYLSQKIGFHMYGKRKGSIINLSSIAGVRASFGQTNYSSSKAAIIGFTKSASSELGKKNVRINAIAPGFVETNMTENLKQKDNLLKTIPLRRFAQPEEIANLVVFLASDLSSYITGETIIIDGGYSA